MRFVQVSLLVVLGFVSNCHAEAQYNFGYPGQYYFRSGFPAPSLIESFESQQGQENRAFFTTVTVTMATTTYTTTVTTSTTCTTSTSNLKICSPSKGRRRRSQRDISSLMYNEAAETEELDPDVFLTNPVDEELAESKQIENAVRKEREIQSIPFVLQPGFRTSENIGSGRFLLAIGTSTLTTTKTSTYTRLLTALCASTTGFQSCSSSSGK